MAPATKWVETRFGAVDTGLRRGWNGVVDSPAIRELAGLLRAAAERACESPEGRPLSLTGAALDVTDRELLRQVQAAESRRRQALYLTSYATTYTVGTDRMHDFPLAVSQVHGLSPQEISLNPFAMIVPEERAAFRDRAMQVHAPQVRFQGTARERLANGEVWHFRIIGVPLWDETGRYLGRAGMKYPVHESGAAIHAGGVPGDEQVRHAQIGRAHV